MRLRRKPRPSPNKQRSTRTMRGVKLQVPLISEWLSTSSQNVPPKDSSSTTIGGKGRTKPTKREKNGKLPPPRTLKEPKKTK